VSITDGSFTVGGIPFADWFNTQIVGRTDFAFPIDGDQFKIVFDHVSDLWAPDLSIEQFVAFFCIFLNETGGSFRPIAEMGGPKYCFETSVGGVPGRKLSYNEGPLNRLAGDQLVERGIIEESLRAAWNGKVWPSASADVYAAARECDFFKFRGHGLIQTTWWKNYVAQVDPLLAAAGLPSCDEMTTEQLDQAILSTPSVYLGMVKAFFQKMPLAFAAVDQRNWAPVGMHVSGSSIYGKGIYTRRCSLLFAEMQKAGVA